MIERQIITAGRALNLEIFRMRRQGEGERDGQRWKEQKQVYLLCIASVQNILDTTVLV
jgi:hypothetical protein